jgi:hypothetical protein
LYAVRLGRLPRRRPEAGSAVEIDLAGDGGGLPIETSVSHSEGISVQVYAFRESGNEKYIAAITRDID